MNFFFDTNVILDYLIPTNSFHEEASKILKAVFEGKANGFISAHSMTDIFYISRKYFSLEDSLQMRCAENAKLDYIVTENLKDFKTSKVPALAISSALSKI